MAAARTQVISEDGLFRVFPCMDVDVPGYVIIAAEGDPGDWNDLSEAQQARLGGVIRQTVAAVKEAFDPERVYVCAFGEAGNGLHFHVFPRYAWMDELCRDSDAGNGGIVDGPALLSRVRRERKCASGAWADPDGMEDAIRALRSRFARPAGTPARGDLV